LHRELAEIDLLSAERHRGLEAGLEHDRELIVWWLATSVRLDYQTGLPWDYLARYRWISDPVLGLVPALINVARARAFAEAPDDIAQLARRLRPDAKPDPFAEAELSQHALTWFPRCLIEAARRGDQDAAAVVEQVRRLWEAPRTRRFLLNATARGWPEHLRESAPVTPR
jgi:hypothetical protein